MSLDISVVTHNSAKWLDNFFASLEHQDFPLKYINLYFYDGGSCDSTKNIIDKFFQKKRFKSTNLISGINVGFGHGHNENFKKCKSEFILTVNPDIEFDKKSIEHIFDTALNDEAKIASWEFRQIPFEHPKIYDPVTLITSWSSSACILFRKSALNKVKGYDEKIFMYCEDVDLSWRLRAAGYLLKYIPTAICIHHTYSENKFKESQFLGSLLGNLNLRYRFGNQLQIEEGENKLAKVLDELENNNKNLYEKLRSYLTEKSNKDYFMNSNCKFSKKSVAKFILWDYEENRSGVFEPALIIEPNHKVSIIIRTYKGRWLALQQAIATCINQTYKNIEILVIEDGGNTLSNKVNSISDLRIKYFFMPKVGRCVTGNVGLLESTGEYLCFLDDDDLLYADHIELLISRLINSRNSLLAYACAFKVEAEYIKNSSGKITKINDSKSMQVFYKKYDFFKLLIENLIPIQSALFHRSLYEKHGGFSSSLDNLEDWDLWLRFSQSTDFISIQKTTSIFRTPKNPKEIAKRQSLLDSYYKKVLSKMKGYSFTNRNYLDLHSMMKQSSNNTTQVASKTHLNVSPQDPTFNGDFQHYTKCGLEISSLIKMLSSIYPSKSFIDISPLYGRMIRHLYNSSHLELFCATNDINESAYLEENFNAKCLKFDSFLFKDSIDFDLSFFSLGHFKDVKSSSLPSINLIKKLNTGKILILAHANPDSKIDYQQLLNDFRLLGFEYVFRFEKYWDNALDITILRRT